jgi:hypothetical protein
MTTEEESGEAVHDQHQVEGWTREFPDEDDWYWPAESPADKAYFARIEARDAAAAETAALRRRNAALEAGAEQQAAARETALQAEVDALRARLSATESELSRQSGATASLSPGGPGGRWSSALFSPISDVSDVSRVTIDSDASLDARPARPARHRPPSTTRVRFVSSEDIDVTEQQASERHGGSTLPVLRLPGVNSPKKAVARRKRSASTADAHSPAGGAGYALHVPPGAMEDDAVVGRAPGLSHDDSGVVAIAVVASEELFALSHDDDAAVAIAAVASEELLALPDTDDDNDDGATGPAAAVAEQHPALTATASLPALPPAGAADDPWLLPVIPDTLAEDDTLVGEPVVYIDDEDTDMVQLHVVDDGVA